MDRRSDKHKELHDEIDLEKKTTIKRRFYNFLITILTTFIIILLYSHFISTKGLIIKEYKYKNNNLPKSFDGLKLIHFGDLHYKTTVHEKELINLVDNINLLKPDIVVFTGDLLDKKTMYTNDDLDILTKYLNDIKVTNNKYIIKGNHDYNNKYEQVINKTDFVLLNNNYDEIYYNKDKILISGSGSSIKKDQNIKDALSYYKDKDNEKLFNIYLTHEPDNTTDILNEKKVDLILSGHSHNGQIRFPFYGPITKVRGAKKYNEEHYKINNTDLFITSGIGTSTYPFRLFNKPSINFYSFFTK